MSKRAVQANFQRSLFKRLQDAGHPVHVLQVQYRMHPTISYFASSTFYEGRIQDGPDVVAQTERPFHKHAALGPLSFMNVDGKEVTPVGSSSICNHAECDMVLALIQCLATQVRADSQADSDEPGILCSPGMEQNFLSFNFRALQPGVGRFHLTCRLFSPSPNVWWKGGSMCQCPEHAFEFCLKLIDTPPGRG
jgi:senataxin